MTDLSGVVGLLYRADWTRLALSGDVSGSDEPVSPAILSTESVRTMPGPSPGPSPGAGETAETTRLHIAPGGRYRRDIGQLMTGSDGTRAWQWFPPGPQPLGDARLLGGAAPPFATLLCPSWLLTGYELAVEGLVTACGRKGIAVTGTARRAGRAATRPAFRGRALLAGGRFERVDAIVDAELGILLRCEESGPAAGGGARLLEFTSLDLDGAADEAMFAPPPGSQLSDASGGDGGRDGADGGDGAGPGRACADEPSLPAMLSVTFPWLFAPAAKAGGGGLAGLAAGGLGALLRRSPVKLGAHRGGREEEQAGEQMPDEDPPPAASGAGTPVSDEVLGILYRAGAAIPRFTAMRHFWVSPAGVLGGVPESARSGGFGGVDHLVDTVAEEDAATTHEVSTIRVDDWFRYRIERMPAASAGARARRADGPLLIACNGKRYWEVRADRVSIDESRPAPAELADLADTSWLLGCELSGGEEVTMDGRPAFRLSVHGQQAQSELLVSWYPAVAVVDAKTGRMLRLTSYGDGKPAFRHELRDVAETVPDDDWDFPFEAPPALRVVRLGADDDRPVTPLSGARAARRR